MPRSDSKDDDKEVVVRTDEGKWPKGVSGNPSGFSADKRKAYKEFVSEMRKRSPKAIAALDRILDDPTSDPNIVLKCVEIVLNRSFGKPIQPSAEVDAEGEERKGPLTGPELMEGARRIMAVLAKAADARFPGIGNQPMSLAEMRTLIEAEPTEEQLAEIRSRKWWDRNRQALPEKAGPLSLAQFRAATAAALRANATDAVVVKQEKPDAAK